MQIFLHLFAQCRAARDQITHLAAHALMDREKDDRAEIEGCVVTKPRVELDNLLGDVSDPIAIFPQARLYSAIKHLASRRPTDDPSHMNILDSTVPYFARKVL